MQVLSVFSASYQSMNDQPKITKLFIEKLTTAQRNQQGKNYPGKNIHKKRALVHFFEHLWNTHKVHTLEEMFFEWAPPFQHKFSISPYSFTYSLQIVAIYQSYHWLLFFKRVDKPEDYSSSNYHLGNY